MFVAGLSAFIRDRSASDGSLSGRQSASRRTSDYASSTLDPSSAAGSVGLSLISPLTSPNSTPHVGLPSSPPPEPILSLSQAPESEVDEREKELRELVENLRGALAPRGGKAKVWLPNTERKDFRIVLVEKVSSILPGDWHSLHDLMSTSGRPAADAQDASYSYPWRNHSVNTPFSAITPHTYITAVP